MKRNSIKISVLAIILSLVGLNFHSRNDHIIKKWAPNDHIIEMPIVQDSKPIKTLTDSVPFAQRDEKYIKYLSASVKINVSGASGSGTIFYYDPKENWAYVISCGHLWSGDKSYKELQKKPQKAKIITWYHNDTKLEESKTYDCEVLFWSNTRGEDCSCMRFQPDWEPNYFAIASKNYKINKGEIFNSLGCDGGDEVARYEVEFIEMRGDDIITKRNSPRPGRSGGGLLTNSGWLVGICWGTSDTTTGNGIGYFTPLKSIHEVFIANGHEWILLISEFSARDIPIRDNKSPNQKFDSDYIPIPDLIISSY
jgi:hypothetical protein